VLQADKHSDAVEKGISTPVGFNLGLSKKRVKARTTARNKMATNGNWGF